MKDALIFKTGVTLSQSAAKKLRNENNNCLGIYYHKITKFAVYHYFRCSLDPIDCPLQLEILVPHKEETTADTKNQNSETAATPI